jgi:hypothetical protein
MITDTITFTIGQHFLSALINGDWTGLDEGDAAQFESWFETASDDYTGSDGNVWAFAHAAYVDGSDNEFGLCEVTGLRGAVSDVQFVFTPI